MGKNVLEKFAVGLKRHSAGLVQGADEAQNLGLVGQPIIEQFFDASLGYPVAILSHDGVEPSPVLALESVENGFEFIVLPQAFEELGVGLLHSANDDLLFIAVPVLCSEDTLLGHIKGVGVHGHLDRLKLLGAQVSLGHAEEGVARIATVGIARQ